MRKFSTFCLVVIASIIGPIAAADTHQTKLGSVVVEKIADGLNTPWAMAMLPDGSLLVTERDGALKLISNGRTKSVQGVPTVAAIGQGGLLDVILDKDFEQNQTIYLSYSKADATGKVGTALSSAKLIVNPRAMLADAKLLFANQQTENTGYHFGSRIVQSDSGSLFVTLGDHGNRPQAQDPKRAAGSVVHINTDGSIPQNNPDPEGKQWLREIWSIGHRNPQGATLNDDTRELWTLSHGPKGGDEINIPKAGKNYGWPIISYGRHYSGGKVGIGTSAPNMEQPIYYWDPSIAPSGMDFYQGNAIPQWKGNLFVGALKFQTLVRLEVEGNKIISEERLFERQYGRIRDVRAFQDGALWFLTDSDNGAIYRVTAAQ